MGYWGDDVYYNPESFGLSVVAEADLGGPYEFDKFVVWSNASGILYWAADVGCSCPSPFEDYRDLESLSTGTAAECHAAIDAWYKNEYRSSEGRDTDVAYLHERVANL